MQQRLKRGQLKRPVIKIGVVVAASAVMSAGAASLLSAGGSGPVALPYTMLAVIDTANTTVGFADSDIIGMSTANINKTLDEMQSLGVQNVRILIPWNNVEPAPGVWNWTTVDNLVNAAASRNMGILAVLNSTPAWAVPAGDPAVATPPANDAQYAQFAGNVATRYAGKVSAYEVWNEPNAATFWYPSPNPTAYTQLLQAAYPAIKTADPTATVIGGVVGWVTDTPGLAISPAAFVQAMYNAGAKGYFDALSYHPYQYQVPFGNGGPYGSASPINQLALMHQEMVAAGDGSKQIWASEYGEPTSVVSQATQASFISNFLNSWSSLSYTGPMFVYTTRDRNTGSTNAQDTFGVFQTDWTPKPAAAVIASWTATHAQTVSLLAPVAAVAATAATAVGDATAIGMTAAGAATAVGMTATGAATAAAETAASTVVASAAGSTGSSSTPSTAATAAAAKPAATNTKPAAVTTDPSTTATNTASATVSASKQASTTSVTATTPATTATPATATPATATPTTKKDTSSTIKTVSKK